LAASGCGGKWLTLHGPAKTFLNVTLVTFYVLGFTCTVYWLGQPWLMGVLPAFIVFFVLFIATIRGVITWSKPA
jgi:uncharacterized membrane protein